MLVLYLNSSNVFNHNHDSSINDTKYKSMIKVGNNN